MPDLQAYQLPAGLYIFGDITEQVKNEIENNTPTATVLEMAVVRCMHDKATVSQLEWYSVSGDFAEICKRTNETR